MRSRLLVASIALAVALVNSGNGLSGTSSAAAGAPYAPVCLSGRPTDVCDAGVPVGPVARVTPGPSDREPPAGPLVLQGAYGAPEYAALSVHNSAGFGLIVSASASGFDGIRVESVGSNGVVVKSATDSGLVVNQAGLNGLFVGAAGNDGTVVYAARGDGFHVCRTGRETTCTFDAGSHGLEVGNAQNDGVHVTAAGDYAGYFNGPLAATACAGCSLVFFGSNVGQSVLQVGDVVALSHLVPGTAANAAQVMEVVSALEGDVVVGVVAGRAELVPAAAAAPAASRLVPRTGPARPGDYVTVLVNGLAQVRVTTTTGPVVPGTRLTASDQPGAARGLRRVTVQGVTVSEDAALLGTALEAAGQEGQVIWALINSGR